VIRMKRNAGKMFIRGFIRAFMISFFVMTLLLGIGVLTYKLVIKELIITEPVKDTAVVAYKSQETEQITVASVDSISKNLIYSFDEETGEIDKLILEIYRTEDLKLFYVTIPVRTQFTMSDTLYRKLITIYPEIPQIIKLSNIPKYFNRGTVFDYGSLIVEDLLQIKLSYYTTIPNNLFDTIFTEKSVKTDNPQSKSKKDTSQMTMTGQNVPPMVFHKSYIKFIKSLNTNEKLQAYLEDIYTSIQSNLSFSDKMKYLDSYSKTPTKNIVFEIIQGVNQNSAYVIDSELAAKQLMKCTSLSNEE
jgi:hypothetical protein